MLLPLYLNKDKATHVSSDGVSLLVTSPETALLRYPMSKLSRVVCANDVQWDTHALLDCINNGIPILFLNKDKTIQGYCFGNRKKENTIGHLLRLNMDKADWLNKYKTWCRGLHVQILIETYKKMRIPLAFKNKHPSESCLFNAHHQRTGKSAVEHYQYLCSLLSSFIAEKTHDAIGDFRLLAYHSPGVNLALDFYQITKPSLHYIIYLSSRAELTSTPTMGWAVRQFHEHLFELESICNNLLNNFEIWLREVDNEFDTE